MEDKLSVTEKTVVLPFTECPYYNINKLKLIFSEVSNRCFKLKISWKSEEFIFGASYQEVRSQRHESFYIFASIIYRKLALMGRKPQSQSRPDFKPRGMP